MGRPHGWTNLVFVHISFTRALVLNVTLKNINFICSSLEIDYTSESPTLLKVAGRLLTPFTILHTPSEATVLDCIARSLFALIFDENKRGSTVLLDEFHKFDLQNSRSMLLAD